MTLPEFKTRLLAGLAAHHNMYQLMEDTGLAGGKFFRYIEAIWPETHGRLRVLRFKFGYRNPLGGVPFRKKTVVAPFARKEASA